MKEDDAQESEQSQLTFSSRRQLKVNFLVKYTYVVLSKLSTTSL